MPQVSAGIFTAAVFVCTICLVLGFAGVIVAFTIRVMRKLLYNNFSTSSNKQS